MTLKEAAAMLDGREYLEEITSSEEELFKENGIVAIFGHYADRAKLRGAINDEIYAWDGTELALDDGQGVINAYWNKNGYPWYIEPSHDDIPCEYFDIVEDGEKYCRGLVFNIDSLKSDSKPPKGENQ